MAADVTSPANVGAANPGTTKFVRRGLLPAVIVAILWLLILAGLSLWTANPVTVNRTQILQSQFILTGRIADPQTGSVEILTLNRVDKQPVDKTWLSKTIELQPIRQNWTKDSERIFPVFRDSSGNWRVTAAPIRRAIDNEIPKENYIDYPDTESVQKEIDRILNQQRKKTN